MDTNLAYLHEAAVLGSMRLAADKLGVAVSTISRQVAQLERELGIQLIEKGRRSIQLTVAGQLAVDYYRTRAADHEALLNQISDLRSARTGRVHLAIGEGLLGKAFLKVLNEYQRQAPKVLVEVTTASSADIMQMVVDDAAHIGFVFNPELHPKSRIRAQSRQPLMLICAPNHPLARKDEIDFATLAEHDLCLPPRGFRVREAIFEVESRNQLWLAPKLVTNSIFAMREIATHGRMATILPPITVLDELKAGTLVGRHFCDSPLEQTQMVLIHRLGRILDGPPARLMAALELNMKAWANMQWPAEELKE